MYVTTISISVIIIAVSIGVCFLFLRRSVLYSYSSRKEVHQQSQGDVSSWKDFEDSSSLFILKYPPEFVLLKDSAAFGPGVFCLKTSNMEERLKDAEGDMQLENCLTYHHRYGLKESRPGFDDLIS